VQRADRLFQLVMLLRARRSTTAAALADDLGVSARTVYRYVKELEDAGVPIEGEAGVGYRLGRGFELPPTSLSPDEIEALSLGLRMVEQQADAELALAAVTLRARLESSFPAPIREALQRTHLFAPRGFSLPARSDHLAVVRQAIATQRRLTFRYTDRFAAHSDRSVRPLAVYYWGGKWTVCAWCEARSAYRNFRPDRMLSPALGAPYPVDDPPLSIEAFLACERASSSEP